MTGTIRVASRAFVGLGAAGITALSGLAQAGVRSADELAKTSQKLGIAADQLAALRFAAEQTGASTRTLDLGLQRMVRRVAEAAQGTGEAQKALKELGLDAKALAQQAPDEQFRQIADAFENIGSQSDKVRLGFKLFDSEGVALVNTLAAGRAELDRFTEESRQLGLSLTQNQLNNVQEAVDAQNRVSKAFQGFARQLGADLAPAFGRAADQAANFITRVTNGLPRLEAFASQLLGIRRNLDALTLRQLDADLKLTFERILKLRKSLRAAEERANTSGRDIAIQAAENLRNELDELIARYNRLFEAREQARRPFEATKESIEAVAEAAERAQAPVQAIVDAFEGGVTRQDRTQLATNRILNSMVEIRDAAERVNPIARDLGFTFESAFESALVSGNKLRDVLKGIYQDLLRIAARNLVTVPLANTITGLLTGSGASAAGAAAGAAGSAVPVSKVAGPSQKTGFGSNAANKGVVINQTINADGTDSEVRRFLPEYGEKLKRDIIETVYRLQAEGRL